MTEHATAVPAGAPPDVGPAPARPPGAADYLLGIAAVIGVLVLIAAAAWLALVVLGVDVCGCTTRPPASP